MVLHFNPVYMDAPRVWVKVSKDDDEPSLFIDNKAVARFAIDNTYKPSIAERWQMTDNYFGEQCRLGIFVKFDDLNEIDDLCLQLGWPKYETEIF